MKYIRTKNEVKAIETTLNSKELYVYLQQFSNYKKNLIKVCDTIEELFDEIVCENKVQLLVNIHTNETKAKMIINTCKELLYKGKKDIYGAIWTDEGLIYKAKMKGVLPSGKIDWELL